VLRVSELAPERQGCAAGRFLHRAELQVRRQRAESWRLVATRNRESWIEAVLSRRNPRLDGRLVAGSGDWHGWLEAC